MEAIELGFGYTKAAELIVFGPLHLLRGPASVAATGFRSAQDIEGMLKMERVLEYVKAREIEEYKLAGAC